MSLELRRAARDGDINLGGIKHRNGIKTMRLNETTKKVSEDGKEEKVQHYEVLVRR